MRPRPEARQACCRCLKGLWVPVNSHQDSIRRGLSEQGLRVAGASERAVEKDLARGRSKKSDNFWEKDRGVPEIQRSSISGSQLFTFLSRFPTSFLPAVQGPDLDPVQDGNEHTVPIQPALVPETNGNPHPTLAIHGAVLCLGQERFRASGQQFGSRRTRRCSPRSRRR